MESCLVEGVVVCGEASEVVAFWGGDVVGLFLSSVWGEVGYFCDVCEFGVGVVGCGFWVVLGVVGDLGAVDEW